MRRLSVISDFPENNLLNKYINRNSKIMLKHFTNTIIFFLTTLIAIGIKMYYENIF